MASADFLQINDTLLCHLSLRVVYTDILSATTARSPRVRTITFPSSICRIYTTGFGQYRTLLWIASSSNHVMPYMRFLSIRPRVCLQLPSDSASRRTPLLLANSSYCQACSGLTPPSYRPCRAHYAKNAPHSEM